ncbi:MAG: hypothetical protein AB8E82_08255 [Aureispira sp.]
MTTLKSNKEVQQAALTFSRNLEQQNLESIEGQFFPADTGILYKKQQRTLAYCFGMGVLCLFIFLYVLLIEFNYYAQLDRLVIACTLFWGVLVAITVWLFNQYSKDSKLLQMALDNPRKSTFGVLITPDYYFEHLPNYYHIIPKSNIIRIDYEEKRDNGEVYLELLIDMDDQLDIRGILYRPEEYELKEWINAPDASTA